VHWVHLIQPAAPSVVMQLTLFWDDRTHPLKLYCLTGRRRSQYSGETADEAKMQLFNVTFVRRGDQHETSPSGTDVHTWGPCSCSQNLPTLSSQKKTTHFCSLLFDNIRSSTATWQNQQRSSAEGIFQRLRTLWIQRLCYRLTHSGTAWPLEL
jgi:hypothetical protein